MIVLQKLTVRLWLNSPGARGREGYFVASSPEEFNKKIGAMKSRGWLEDADVS